ncbi:hypothetical protein HPB51_025695 [Rhipicephalus microplus]|uniref:Serine-threonine/tyrosine-protein kinase catalytic domain-containing protein n=1 Tax=Rhipicephalus microplus TaxID=6941 RepID=A0A9J6EPJ2_RHIMP|nr:hypothetical protein HPB51_025695 [Rhipicephalus microplus]
MSAHAEQQLTSRHEPEDSLEEPIAEVEDEAPCSRGNEMVCDPEPISVADSAARDAVILFQCYIEHDGGTEFLPYLSAMRSYSVRKGLNKCGSRASLAGWPRRALRTRVEKVALNALCLGSQLLQITEAAAVLRRYDQHADIFSYGIILCELIVRLEADPDVLPRTADFGVDRLALRRLCPDDCPPAFLRLALACCQVEPLARPTFQNIVEQLEAMLSGDVADADSASSDATDDSIGSVQAISVEMVNISWAAVMTTCKPNCFREADFVDVRPDAEPEASELWRRFVAVVQKLRPGRHITSMKTYLLAPIAALLEQNLVSNVGPEQACCSTANPFAHRFKDGRKILEEDSSHQ